MKTKRLVFVICFLLATQKVNAQSLLWATATKGGANGSGTILQADSTGANFHFVFSFPGISGYYPHGKLTLANNSKIYGITLKGSTSGDGILYSYDPFTGIYNPIHEFCISAQNGCDVFDGLLQSSNGMLYGSCPIGGSLNGGLLYSLDPATDSFQVVHNFSAISIDGDRPYGNLLEINGILYGTTYYGGIYNDGVIFSFDPLNNVYTKLHDFYLPSGCHPNRSGLMQASNGNLYGTTCIGGINGYGVIYSFDLTNNSYLKLHDFDSQHGASPVGTLIEPTSGVLYGLTWHGGYYDLGVLYKFDINSNTQYTLFEFDSINGAAPHGGLTILSNGNLIGTCRLGGDYADAGTIFSFDISTNSLSKLFEFNIVSGSFPDGFYPECDILKTPVFATSIQTLNANASISVYPNPAVNSITVNADNNFSVEFIDVYGRILKTLLPHSITSITVDVSAFPNVFFVRNKTTVKKVVRKGM